MFNGVPECLKIWSPKKTQLLKDFNDQVEQFIEESSRLKLKPPLIIFTFSDPNEITKPFLNKLFSRRIMQDHQTTGFVKILQLNPPTDKEIEKVLHQIINREGGSNIAINKF